MFLVGENICPVPDIYLSTREPDACRSLNDRYCKTIGSLLPACSRRGLALKTGTGRTIR